MPRYLTIQAITYGEGVPAERLEALLGLELVRYRRSAPDAPVEVVEDDCEDLRAMLRLSEDLGINPAGVETIMHMRRRMQSLQEELRRLRAIENMYARR